MALINIIIFSAAASIASPPRSFPVLYTLYFTIHECTLCLPVAVKPRPYFRRRTNACHRFHTGKIDIIFDRVLYCQFEGFLIRYYLPMQCKTAMSIDMP